MKTPLALLILGACWTGQPAVPRPDSPKIAVTLAAVTLADDCGDPTAMKRMDKPQPGEAPIPADCGVNGCAMRSCEQTSMQLSLRATDGASWTSVRVKMVELLDVNGKRLDSLQARSPAKWNDSAYVAWNEQIAPNQKIN